MNRVRAESIRVLHVDDDSAFADLTAEFLEREDDRLAVETATDASEGLDRLASEAFDCVVSDHQMPGCDGIEFLEAVREAHGDLPFVLFTGEGSEAVASDAVSAGVTEYVRKGTGTDRYAVLANRVTNAVEHVRSRRLAERSERRLRQIVDALPHLLYVVDGDGRYLLANEATAAFHDTSVAAIEGATVGEVLGDSLGREFREDLADVLRSGSPKRKSEVETTDAAGNRHAFEPRILPYESAGTDERAVLGFALDVTERREREREAERARERMELALERTSSVVFEVDFETGRVVRHGTYERSFDLPPEEAPTWEDHCENVVHPDDREAFRRFHRELIDGDRERGGIEYRTSPETGESRWIRAHVHTKDGGRRAIGISRDITDRREYEEQLAALNETTQDLVAAETREAVAEVGVEAARDVLGLDVNTIYLAEDESLVPAAHTEAGYALVGEPPTFADDDSIARRVYEEGEPVAVDDVHDDPDVHNPDSPVRGGLYLPIRDRGLLIAASPTPGAFGERDLVLGEILAGNVAAALEQVEQTERLRARERELSRQNERLDGFASIVSHDLRSPLNVAQGHLGLAREGRGDEHFTAVADALDRMEALVEDLLTLAREGEGVHETEPVDLVALSRECWDGIETGTATLVADGSRTVRADRDQLRRLFENLFRNAVEHGGDGVTVTVGATDGGFCVADDGPGIPADRRGSVFEAGYSTSRDGTGFGLHIVERVADAHDWTVAAGESSDGGARFEIAGVTVVTSPSGAV